MVIYIILTIICGGVGYLAFILNNKIEQISSNFTYLELSIKTLTTNLIDQGHLIEGLRLTLEDIETHLDEKDFKGIVYRLRLLEKFEGSIDEKMLILNKKTFNDFEKVYNNINQLRMNIKALGNDPNTINRY